MQLRDEIPGIVAPGCWGLFGGQLNPVETPEQALRRELLEEIRRQPQVLHYAMEHRIHRRTAHVFRAELSVPLEGLQLLEGEDMALVSAEECSPERSGAAISAALVRWPMGCWR